jgi:hypothetical protein
MLLLLAKKKLGGIILQNMLVQKKSVTSSRTIFFEYLEDKVLSDDENLDIIGWWKARGLKYPILQMIARDLLVIPISTVV